MLASRTVTSGWPQCISLPTGSGKTACLDIAAFALATTAKMPIRMPRRIWFVVDRRIVVDEAFERAIKLAEKLNLANTGPLGEVARELRGVSGTERALAVARLRGGTWRDDGWAHVPSQPAIICSTVDQIGSALLFRAYGHGDSTASIFAGLAGNDSLIMLDEAHCAVPFLQTLRAVARFRDTQWSTQPLKTPFCFTVMSATPPPGIPDDAIFPKASERVAALDHPLLEQRCTAHKPTNLVDKKDAEFIDEAVNTARNFCEARNKRRIAIMVNRVATAEQIAELLRDKLRESAEVILLTGRMRPLDRDALVSHWEPLLKADSIEVPAQPLIVVSTQCLEVGADFSFDALITECASLDALRQRFGRLDRLGKFSNSPGVVLIRKEDTETPKDEDGDPIYGKAIYETWTWLNELARQEPQKAIDFGINAMDVAVNSLLIANEGRIRQLLAPTPDAPVLLPVHLDLLSQTSQHPVPEPDISLFLHGKTRVMPEVRIIMRADLPDPATVEQPGNTWVEILSLVPPTSPEMLTVPLHRFRRWLLNKQADDITGDIEGMREFPEEKEETNYSSFLIWRGRNRSVFTSDLNRIRPNDAVVLRLEERGFHGLGQVPEVRDGLGPNRLDLAEHALLHARGRVILRIQPDTLRPLLKNLRVAHLLEVATDPEIERDQLYAALREILEEDAKEMIDAHSVIVPDWFKGAIEFLAQDDFRNLRREEHPAGGLILIGRKPYVPGHKKDQFSFEDDPLADEEDLTSKSNRYVSLRQHTADVCAVAEDFAGHCLGEEFTSIFLQAAQFHDLGKLDRRFQILLRNGNEEDAMGEPLAKSPQVPERHRRRAEIEEDYRLPKGFRHEFLSMQIAEHFISGESSYDLILHLIASHHGYARPFAPVVLDPFLSSDRATDLSLASMEIEGTFSAKERQGWLVPHRLDSGVADRFWRLNRRFGWWGLAYLEAVFRLADWKASSESENNALPVSITSHIHQFPERHWERINLDAIDGANPLGFLAALGIIRLLSAALPDQELRLS
ncbi:MAG TPA: type I-U CRISPR-associated helicase/endonuclease Cas3, partial [Candidatus Angelobacter sp.]|nr:type I-U CRISPR-associated helicase/endonuclease Cas3 [Candidatus Angelobacter sp.]